jgi:hypothetical protein
MVASDGGARLALGEGDVMHRGVDAEGGLEREADGSCDTSVSREPGGSVEYSKQQNNDSLRCKYGMTFLKYLYSSALKVTFAFLGY